MLASLAVAAATAQGQIAAGPGPLTTATQAVLSYTAPDEQPCTVEVREQGSAALVHDVNPALFPGAHLDNRAGSAIAGRRRVVVVGKRSAEVALDGKRYSRALQTDTGHTYTVTCSGGAVWSGTFRTTNIPLGSTFMEGPPADPNEPGTTAWPALAWNDRSQTVIDPQTGVQIKRLSLPGDLYNTETRDMSGAESASPEWTAPQAVLADDSDAASYSGTSRAYLFLDMPFTSGFGGSYSAPFNYLTQLQLNVNAWCSGGDCASASPEDRSLEFCITNDRATCLSQAITVQVQNCDSGCTGASYRFVLGDDMSNSELLPAWFSGGAYANAPFNMPEAIRRIGTVNRDGNVLTRVSGNRFSLYWKAGMKITVNSQTYTIASVDSDKSLTLADAPAGVETGVPFSISNFGLLVRKKTASTTPVYIQNVRAFLMTGENPPAWDPSGAYSNYSNCSNALTPGSNGEQGWHCQIAGLLYWIGKDSGTANLLGRTFVEGRSGVDGFPRFFCNGFWDKTDPNRYYCVAPGSDVYEPVVIQMQYNGQNQAAGPLPFAPLRECGTPPCWVVTNLTKASENRKLSKLVSDLHPDFAGYRTQAGFELLTLMGSSAPRLLLRAYPVSVTNDLLGFYAIFNAQTGAVEGAAPSWKYWPNRWSALHGYFDTGDSSLVQMPVTTFRGPSTGYDSYPGNGPYQARIVSGAITTAGEPCPARPADSPIPANEWPQGNVCLTITVDGEPGDPTPAVYTAGTITINGNNVTGSGVSWNNLTDGRKMKIGSDYFTFTRTSSTTGTLSPAPPQVTDNAYTLFLEEIDNPKTGPNRRENAYLQDVEIRDTFCLANNSTGYFYGVCGQFGQTEYVRLIAKNGNTWTVERGYSRMGTRSPILPLNANGYVTAMPTACEYGVYPCHTTLSYWKVDQDPLAQGPGLFAIPPSVANGSGHAFTRSTVEVSAVALTGCPNIDGDAYACYNVRMGADTYSTVTSPKNALLSSQPAFAGKIGIGSPNIVDSHPSPAGPLTAAENPGTLKWFLDARPLFGNDGVTATRQSPAVKVGGDLYKLTASQVPYLRRKVLPSFGSCGMYPLVDVSGPSSVLTGTSADRYKYCIADRAGECSSGSQQGDVFFNCPQMADLYCTYGAGDSDLRDVCIGGHSSYTGSIVQVGYEKQNLTGNYGRPLTKGFSRYRLFDTFWNAKTTPDGKWLIFRTLWANGYDHEILLAKIPPAPVPDNVNRTDFVPLAVTVGAAPAGTSATQAVVEFGYNTSFHCTSRAETCVKGNAAGYAFAYENPATVSCATGCRIDIPAIPQRVVYYRVVRKDASGNRLWEGPTEVLVSP
jgi:hypothetical protein